MKYHIFVTIQEFLQNGGVIKANRPFFSQETGSSRGQYLYREDGCFQYEGDKIMMLVHPHPHPHAFYVKIEVTPIWQ